MARSIFLLIFINICQALLIGANIESNPTENKEYDDLSWRALIAFNKANNDIFSWIPVKILESKTVKSIGVKHTIRVVIARSECFKNVVQTITEMKNNCKPDPNIKLQACTFEIQQIHWKLPEHVRFLSCSDYFSEKVGAVINGEQKPAESSAQPAGSQHSRKLEIVGIKDSSIWDHFISFMNRFERIYSSVEEKLKRFKIFKQNMRKSQKIMDEERGTATYGATKFSDLTEDEFKKVMLPMVWPIDMNSGVSFDPNKYNLSLMDVPENFDWRHNNIVTAVKNQGQCGSCWAFSVTGNIEGLWAIKTGNLISLSEQELIDCDVVDKGCSGGLPINAFKEIIRMGGLEREEDYPYRAMNGTCHLVRPEIAVYINDSVQLSNDEDIMKAWIARKGPLSIGIDADLLMHYKDGIMHPPRRLCPPSGIDHGVLIVGYGVENGMPYWTIKNSWGERWGEKGYFRVLRGKDVCGVSDLVSSAIIY